MENNDALAESIVDVIRLHVLGYFKQLFLISSTLLFTVVSV